mmetsp:Transcript_127342/g.220732  ORF Transcript_127342/g.220732 Transcript_127342/m.220732 type:complete len:355 (+) Transcript_127342:100-1164(+)
MAGKALVWAVPFATLLHAAAAHFLAPRISQRGLDQALVLLQEVSQRDTGCSAGPDVSRQQCLAKGEQCMWLETESKNLCLPCKWGEVNIPCVPNNAVFGGKKVKKCAMKCAHQQVISKVSACTDVSGSVTADECFAKGSSALTKCMWTKYKTRDEQMKTICGPCVVDGVGTIPPYGMGNLGPEPGSQVHGSASMCETNANSYGVPCGGPNNVAAVTNCRPTPLPPFPTAGAGPPENFGIKVDANSPQWFASFVPAPFDLPAYSEAAAAAARAAGWPAGSVLPPDAPVLVFGPPPLQGPTLPPGLKAMYGPNPIGIPGLPPPGYGVGTVPPPEKKSFISLHRERKRLRLKRARRG